MRKRSVAFQVFVLAPLVIMMAFGMDIYLPSVPSVSKELNVSQFHVQLTLSLYMAMVSVGQLFFGPLSDRLGRKTTSLGSLLLFCLASLGCWMANDIASLIFFRMTQAFGACGALVCAFAIVQDLNDQEQDCARVYSYLNAGLGIAPIIAPLIGSLLIVYFDWRSCFLFLAALGILSLANFAFRIEETNVNKISGNGYKISDYVKIAGNPHFLKYALPAGVALGAYFTFFSVSPHLLINELGVSQTHFGALYSIVAAVFMLSSICVPAYSTKYGIYRTKISGLIIMLAGASLMIGCQYLSGLSIIAFIGPMCLISVGIAFVMGVSSAGALEPFKKTAGIAAAVFGAIQFGLTSSVATFVMQFKVDTLLPLAVSIYVTGGCALLFSILSTILTRERAEGVGANT